MWKKKGLTYPEEDDPGEEELCAEVEVVAVAQPPILGYPRDLRDTHNFGPKWKSKNIIHIKL